MDVQLKARLQIKIWEWAKENHEKLPIEVSERIALLMTRAAAAKFDAIAEMRQTTARERELE